MDNTYFRQIGNNILNALEAQGKTQQYLAQKLNISKQVMSKIVSGSKAINVAEISKIASVLGVSTDSLLSVKQEETVFHNFSFMGQVQSERVQDKIALLQTVIDEILMLEEYIDEEYQIKKKYYRYSENMCEKKIG